MADLSQFVRYLDRPDVSELVLQTGRPACVRRGEALVPHTRAELRHEHLVAIITRPPVARPVPPSDTAGRPETVTIAGRDYELRVARRGEALQVRITEAAVQDASAFDPAQLEAATSAPQAPATRPSPPAPRSAAAPGVAAPSPSTAPARPRSDAPTSSRAGVPGSAPRMAAPIASPARAESSTAPGASARISSPAAATGAGLSGDAPPWRRADDPETMLTALMAAARSANASDVLVVSGRPALVRVFGQLEASGAPLEDDQVRRMLFPLLSPRDRTQLDERGYCDFACEIEGAGRLRVNVARQRTGLKGTFRLIRAEPPTVESLGLPHALTKITRYHQGMIVISGPNGHGKTTTLAALVNLINRAKPDHIITVEDPVEILYPRSKAVITQRQVGAHTASFEAALKGALREDPDVIVIGELRDRETVEMALSAAETGHLVLATMSTPSGAKTIDRLIDMFPPDDQSQVRATLAGALKMVISQRLVALADGSGMTVAIELITGNVALWNLIRDNKLFQLPSLLQRGAAYGMIRLEESLKQLVDRGKITREEAARWANDPRSFIDAASPAAGPTPETAEDETGPIPGAPSTLGGGLRGLFGKKGS